VFLCLLLGMPPEDMLKKAEQEVIKAARAWAREVQSRQDKLTPVEQNLKLAVFMLKKAFSLSGEYRFVLPTIPDDDEEKK
jgi:hypothetical protein